jgi:osmotically-inducible protein OsmY
MNKIVLAVALSGIVAGAGAQEKTVTVPGKHAETYTPQTKDPQQSRNEQTTQIATNTAKGTAPINYKGAGTVDEDLRQRILVALSTGSIGTQGVIASDQLTDIKVAVTNRVVTLNGEVTSEKSKKTIEKRVAGLDGVQKVNNQLKINPSHKPAHADLLKPDGYTPGRKDQRTQDGKRVEDLDKK